MIRLKNIALALILFTLLAYSFAFASDTRVLTMGDANSFVIDEANIFLYPHMLQKYAKLVNAEYRSGSDFASIGGNFPLSDGADPKVIGVYFYENSPIYFGLGSTNQPQIGGMVLPNQRISILYGQNFGGTPYGVGLNYISASEKGDTTSLERSNFELDLLFSSEITTQLEVAAGISFWNFKDINAADSELVKTSGNLYYTLYGRYWMAQSGQMMPVLHLDFSNMKETIDDVDYTDLMFSLGIGMNYNTQQNALLVGDFGFMYASEKQSAAGADIKSTYAALPYFKAGVEADLFKWMDFRAGVTSYWNSQKDENVEKYSYVNTSTYLGAGFHWGKLDIDAQLAPQFLRNGPYFISGVSTGGGLASRISLIYWLN